MILLCLMDQQTDSLAVFLTILSLVSPRIIMSVLCGAAFESFLPDGQQASKLHATFSFYQPERP